MCLLIIKSSTKKVFLASRESFYGCVPVFPIPDRLVVPVITFVFYLRTPVGDLWLFSDSAVWLWVQYINACEILHQRKELDTVLFLKK